MISTPQTVSFISKMLSLYKLYKHIQNLWKYFEHLQLGVGLLPGKKMAFKEDKTMNTIV